MSKVALVIFERHLLVGCTKKPDRTFMAIPVPNTYDLHSSIIACREPSILDELFLTGARLSNVMVNVDPPRVELNAPYHLIKKSDDVSRSDLKKYDIAALAITPNSHHIPIFEWFDPILLGCDSDSDSNTTPKGRFPFTPEKIISVPEFLIFVGGLDSVDHKYKKTVIEWINNGFIVFSTESPVGFGPSLHVEKILIKRTGPWSLSEFMSLDELIGDYLRAPVAALETIT